MTDFQSGPDPSRAKKSMELNGFSSPCPPRLTPPFSSTKEITHSRATVQYLEQLLESVLSDLKEPPPTPIRQETYQPGPSAVALQDLLTKLIQQSSEPAQSDFEGSGQETATPICTTPDHFRSFEKWASKSQFITILETYGPPLPF